jgi:hypothetical protein
MNDERTGLTDQQVSELRKLEEEYRAKADLPLDKLVGCVSCYLGYLAVSGAAENAPETPALEKTCKKSNRERGEMVRIFGSLLGRTPTPDDLIQELSRFATVPPALANAIRRDVERLLALGRQDGAAETE